MEMIEEEATRAETEEPDEPDDQVGDDDEVAEEEETPVPVGTGPVFDEKALERELSRHEKAMQKVLGDGWAGMEPCGGCGSAGYVPAGYVSAPELQPDPNCVVCDDCKGIGSRSTGSFAPGSEIIPCSVCNGAGWRDRGQIEAMRAAQAYQPPPQQYEQPPAPTWNQRTQQYELPNGQPYQFSQPATSPSSNGA